MALSAPCAAWSPTSLPVWLRGLLVAIMVVPFVVDDRDSSLLDEPEQEARDSEDGKQHEQDLGDARRAGGDAAEAEQRGDQRNDEEDNGVVQHGFLLTGVFDTLGNGGVAAVAMR